MRRWEGSSSLLVGPGVLPALARDRKGEEGLVTEAVHLAQDSGWEGLPDAPERV